MEHQATIPNTDEPQKAAPSRAREVIRMSYARKPANKILMDNYLNLMPQGDKQAEIGLSGQFTRQQNLIGAFRDNP